MTKKQLQKYKEKEKEDRRKQKAEQKKMDKTKTEKRAKPEGSVIKLHEMATENNAKNTNNKKSGCC